METSGDIALEEEEFSNIDEDIIVIPEFTKIINANPLTQDKGTPKGPQMNETGLLDQSNGPRDSNYKCSRLSQNYQEAQLPLHHSLMADSTQDQRRIVVSVQGNNMIFKRKIPQKNQNISMTPTLSNNQEQEFTFYNSYRQPFNNEETNLQNVCLTSDQNQCQLEKGSLKYFIQLEIMIVNRICNIYHFSFQIANLLKKTFNWCNSSYILKKICYHKYNMNTQRVQNPHWSFPAYFTRILSDFRFMSHFKDQVSLMQIILFPLQIRHLFSLMRIRRFSNPTFQDKISALEEPEYDDFFYEEEGNYTMKQKQRNVSQFGRIYNRRIDKKKGSISLDGINQQRWESEAENPYLTCLKGAFHDGQKTINGTQFRKKKGALKYKYKEANFTQMVSSAKKQSHRATSSNGSVRDSERVTPYPQKFMSNEYNKEVYYDEIQNDLLLVTRVQRKHPNPKLSKVSTKAKTIVFDLDETLLRCGRSFFELRGNPYDFKTIIQQSDDNFLEIFVSLRPYLFDMLLQLSKDFELIMFTSGNEQYAEQIANHLQRAKPFFDFVLARKQCTPHPNKQAYIKDLRLLLSNRDIKDIIIVDNKPSNFVLHFTNGIPIKEYFGDKTDNELASLTQYLKTFLKEPDVRQKIKQDFKLQPFIKLRKNVSRDMNSIKNSSQSKLKYQ